MEGRRWEGDREKERKRAGEMQEALEHQRRKKDLELGYHEE